MREALSHPLIWLVANQEYLKLNEARRMRMWELEEIMRHYIEQG